MFRQSFMIAVLLLIVVCATQAQEPAAGDRATATSTGNPPVRVLPVRVQGAFQNQVALILQEFGIIRLLGPVGTVRPAVDKARADILSVLVEQKLIPADTAGAKSDTLSDATRIKVLATLQALNVAGFSITGTGTGTGTTGGGGATPPGGITTVDLADGSVTTPKLADGAVTAAKVGDKEISAAKINSQAASSGMVMTADGSGGASWQSGTVGSVTQVDTGAGLTGGPITTLGTISIANNGVTAGMLAPGSVTGGAGGVIQDGSVTNADLAAGAVDLNSATVTNVLPLNKGGTGNNVVTNNGVVYGGAASLQSTPASSNAGDVLMTPAAGGAPQFGLITDSNVSNAAAISGSKVVPNFASQNVTTSGDISTSGTGRITSADTLTAAKGANGLVLGTGANATTISSTATAARSVSLPDNSGTVALLSDISVGNLSGQIVDANVANGAAIAGTKIAPNFGTQNVTTSGNVSTTGTGTITSSDTLTAAKGGSGFVLGTGNNATTLSSTAGSPRTIDFPNNSGVLALLTDISVANLSGLIADANVSNTAAIAGTKVSPNFGTQAVTTSGDISTSGTGKITSNDTLTAAKAASGLVVGVGANGTTLSSTATAARAIDFPNNSGTLALTSDITASSLSGTVPVSKGGTGVTSLTSNGVVYGNDVGNAQVTSASANAGEVLMTATAGGAPSFGLVADANVSNTAAIAGTKIAPNFGTQAVTTSGDISTSGTGRVTSSDVLTAGKGANGFILGSGANATAFSSTATAARSISLPDSSGTIALTSDIKASNLTGVVGVPNGGTGVNTLTSNGVLYGNGAGNVQATGASSGAGQVLMTAAAGGAPDFGTISDSSVSNTAAIAGTKIAPDFGAQNVTTNGTVGGATITSNSQSGVQLQPYGPLAGNTGELRMQELSANGTDYVALKAPDTIAAPVTWTLPNTDGTAGQVLSTDGAGTLSWVPSAGSSGVQIGPGAAQTDGSANPAIFLNKTSVSGTLLQLQQAGANRFIVDNSGVVYGGSANNANLTLDSTTSATKGRVVLPSSGLTINPATNQIVFGAAGTQTTLNVPAQAANRTLSVPALAANDTLATLGTAQTFTGAKTFNAIANTGLNVQNPAATQTVSIRPSAETANRVLTIPLLGANDTLATLGTAQTFTGAKTFNAIANTGLNVQNPAATQTVSIRPSAETANRVLTIPLLGANDTLATLGTAQTFTGAKTFSSAASVTAASNQINLGAAATQTTISAPAQAAARTLTIPTLGAGGARTVVTTAATAAEVESLRIVRGRINITGATATVVNGTGFSVARNNTGLVTVTITTAFSAVPSVTASSEAAGTANNSVHITSTAAGSFQLQRVSAGAAADGMLDFIAIGPP